MLFLNNDDIHELLNMRDCINIQEEAFKGLAKGHSIHRPRIDMYVPCERDDGYWRWGTMEGATHAPGPYFAIRMKSDVIQWTEDKRSGLPREDKYCVEPGTYCGLIMLFSTRNGEPLAMMNDGHLQHMRVGGGAGIGVKHLSREDSTTVGMLGSGGMARTYLQAFCSVRPITRVKVYSPSRENRELYAREMEQELQLEVIPVDSAREAVRGVDIVSSCTSSMVPTIESEWLESGMHVTNLGPFELSEELLLHADVVIRQGIAGGAPTAGEDPVRVRSGVGHSPVAYIAGTEEELRRLPEARPRNPLFRRDCPDFSDLVSGKSAGRQSPDDITLYINGGNQGLQFASVGGLVYEAARLKKLGRELPSEWFVQDIRD